MDTTAEAAASIAGDERGPLEADGGRERQGARRMAYFMLFRLVLTAAITLLSALIFYAAETEPTTGYTTAVWSTIGAAYALTFAYSWALPRAADFARLGLIQTIFDILLAAVATHLTGGIESGFVFLYLLAILGAAVVGDRWLSWTAAAACAAVFVTTSLLQLSGTVLPTTWTGQPYAGADSPELWFSLGRTLAAMAGVTVLSAYLNLQLETTVSQIGNLRALNENIVQSLASGLVTVDRQDRVVFCNRAAKDILGLDDRDLSRPLSELLPGFQPSAVDPQSRFDVVVDRGGRKIHLGLSAAPLCDTEGTYLGRIVNFQDVTRLHDLADQVRRNERLAAIGSLAASVAHEVRNPLAAISGSAELLSSTPLSEEDTRLLDIIRRESTRLASLVTDLLAFTRPRPLQPVRIDMFRALAEAADSFRSDPANAGIEIHFTGESGVEVEADPSQLTQVVWNLMRNAADALGGKGRLALRVFRDHEAGVIEVADDGPGIDPEIRDRIFDPFFTTKDSGTGFGLSLVHRIVQDHGGSIRLKPDGPGATFEIRIPLAAE